MLIIFNLKYEPFMTKNIILALLFCRAISFAQISDLSELAQGEAIVFHALVDKKDKFFGYFSLYDKGLKSSTEKSFEFIILDKNLTEIIRHSFQAEILISSYRASLDVNSNIILYPILDYTKKEVQKGNFLFPELKQLDLTSGILDKYLPVCYENKKLEFCSFDQTLKVMEKDSKKERKENGFIESNRIHKVFNKGFLVFEYKEFKKFNQNYKISFFNTEKSKLWEHSFGKPIAKNITEQLQILSIDTMHLCAIRVVKNKSALKAELLIIETETGKFLKQETLKGLKESELNSIWTMQAEGTYKYVENIKNQEDNITIIGLTKDDWDIGTGYFRILIDKSNNFNIKYHRFLWEYDVSRFITNINQYGKVEKGYKLAIRDLLYTKNGSVFFLFEKFKNTVNFWTGMPEQKTTDLIILKTDPDFNISVAKVINKELSKYGTDYLFSQYLNDENDIVFFYSDYKKTQGEKDKNWVLFINTIIDGVYNEESINISSDKHFIAPYIAKEGYILLREYSEKSEHNSIRLEKLNY